MAAMGCHLENLFSSPEQESRKAIVLPSASVVALTQILKISLKVLRPHYFLTLSPI